AGELGAGGVEADLQPGHLAVPTVGAGFGDAVGEVADDLGEPGALARVDPQHGAADAGVFVRAGTAVGAPAAAEFEFALFEVLLELAPFGVGGFAVLGLGAQRSAGVEEPAIGADQLVVEDCVVALDGGQGLVTEQPSGDVHGQASADGLGGEDPAEVMGSVAQRFAGGVA